MVFTSLDYVVFLVAALAGYWLLQRSKAKQLWFLFAVSCVFYMAWNPGYIVLILGSTLVDYIAAAQIHATENPRRRKAWLVVSLTFNLGLLGLFKYFNFFSEATAGVATWLTGVDYNAPQLGLLLPVGISFYTFQTLSYTLDVYRREIKPAPNFVTFGAFITYFPQLVAGPIVRASQLIPQLLVRAQLRRDQVAEGLFLILVGAFKKIAIADFLSANLVDRVFDQPSLYTSGEIIIGLYAFTMQIYCDFSGYTDFARGTAKLMGLDLPENFDRPYQATSPAEFWRRWHITLSTWLRDYLYYPLGGSKSEGFRAYFNLWLTMFLIGVWHGASWTFVLYALLQAGAMVIHRFFYRRAGRTRESVDRLHVHAFKVFWALQFVVFSRILFRATSIENAHEVANQLLRGSWSLGQIAPSIWIVLVASFVAHYFPRGWFVSFGERFKGLTPLRQGLALGLTALLLAHLATAQPVPYIYFQF